MKIIHLDIKKLPDYEMHMLTPEQSRAARGWLGWTQQDLASKADVGLSTLRAFESGHRAPMRNNLGALRRVIEDAGVHLMFGPDGEATGIAVGNAGAQKVSLANAANAS